MHDLTEPQPHDEALGPGPSLSLGQLFPGLQAIAQAFQEAATWYDEHRDDIRDWAKDAEARAGGPWGWLIHRVDAFTGLAMMGGLAAEGKLLPKDLREGRVLVELLLPPTREEAFLGQIISELTEAPISDVHRSQLLAGLEAHGQERYPIAVSLLIAALEGIFWRDAESRRLITSTGKGKWKDAATGRPVGGLEGVLALMSDEIDPELCVFLRAVVYGGPGDQFRHGVAIHGWDLRSALLVFALVGWLDSRQLLDARDRIRNAFIEYERSET